MVFHSQHCWALHFTPHLKTNVFSSHWSYVNAHNWKTVLSLPTQDGSETACMIDTEDFTSFSSSFSLEANTSVGAYFIEVYVPEVDILFTSCMLCQITYYLDIHSCARSRQASIDNKCQIIFSMLIIKRSHIYTHMHDLIYTYYTQWDKESIPHGLKNYFLSKSVIIGFFTDITY